jgi:hypothetical protein
MIEERVLVVVLVFHFLIANIMDESLLKKTFYTLHKTLIASVIIWLYFTKKGGWSR